MVSAKTGTAPVEQYALESTSGHVFRSGGLSAGVEFKIVLLCYWIALQRI